jgi:PAS domain S-box-containing protein
MRNSAGLAGRGIGVLLSLLAAGVFLPSCSGEEALEGTEVMLESAQEVGAPQFEPLPGLDPARPLTQFAREVWSERDGLPQNFVNALAQTPDGYLWLGSERGLVRFDGLRFTVFTREETPGLSSSWARSLHADADGTLWIGTGGEGLVRLRSGVFTPFGGDDGLDHGMVTALHRDTAGVLWVGTEGGGLHRMEGDRFHPVGSDSGLDEVGVFALEDDGAGGLWVGTSQGVAKVVPGGSDDPVEVRWFGPEEGLPPVPVRALAPDHGEGTVRVGTPGAGLFEGAETFTRLDRGGELGGVLITRLLADRQGSLWVASNGDGLFRVTEGIDGEPVIDGLDTARGFPSNLLWDLLEDREGNLWVGSNVAGLIRLQDGLFDTFGAPEGLSMDVALALMEASNGDLWVGTPGEGINRIRDGAVRTFRAEDGLGSDIVLSVAEGSEGEVWVGMAAGGLTRIRGEEVDTFTPADGLGGGQVSVVHRDGAGSLWLGVANFGVQEWLPGPGESYRLADGVPGGGITSMADDGSGVLWVGTREGLARIATGDTGEGSASDRIRTWGRDEGLPHDGINQLHLDGDGVLWVATMGGLARIEGDEVLDFSTGFGLPEAEPMAVITDGLGYLWITSSQGIARVRAEGLVEAARDDAELPRIDDFGRADGLRSAEANGGIHPAAWQGMDGSLWFPTMAGAIRVDPTRTVRPTLRPEPLIEEVLVGDRSLTGGGGPLRFDPDQRSLEFRFSAPMLVAPENLSFRYRLRGLEEEWISAGDRRSAVYTQLPPGSYDFEVEAVGRDGIWNPVAATLPVELEPRFLERRVVQAGGLLLLLLVAVGGYTTRIRRMEARESELVDLVRQRERTEAELRRSEKRLRLALEAGRMGTWEWHPESGRVVWSQGMTELLGFEPRTLEDFLAELMGRLDPSDRERVDDALRLVLTEQLDDFHLDFALQVDEGESRQIELRGQWAEEEDGGIRRIVGVAADVTELIEAERALRLREEELRKSQKLEAIGQLAGGVAHDFNNLLAVIGANTRLALHDIPEGHPAHEELSEVIRAGDRATTLTQQLLAFGRKQVLQPRRLDLNEVVGAVERMLGRLIRENVTLVTELEMGLAPVRADEGGVEQILVNLVLNAQDAMPEGGTVTIGTRNVAEPSPHVVLTVEDTGHGMDEATKERIFEPFFTTKEQGKGTGLGLASVYGLVQQSGARVEVESALGEGAIFRIRFPLDEAPERAMPAPAPEGTSDPAAEGDERILLVEDDPSVRRVSRRALERYGYTVIEAGGGEEALRRLEALEAEGDAGTPPVDLLLTDVVMPEMDGPELARRVGRTFPDLPVLLMSGHSEELVRTMAGGGEEASVSYLPKPFSPEVLARSVRRTLEGR